MEILSDEKYWKLVEILGEAKARAVKAMVEGKGAPLVVADKSLGGGHVVRVGLKHAAEGKAVPKSPLTMTTVESIDAIQLERAKSSPALGEILPGRVYATDELAVLLHVHRKSLARWCAEGRLHGSKSLDHKGWRILGQNVLNLLQR